MRQIPALFSTEMVKALLQNRKTMTRRTKGLEKVNIDPDIWEVMPHNGKFIFDCQTYSDIKPITCNPNYMVGDHIYVKESYYAYGYWKIDGKTKTGKEKLRFIDCTSKCFYKYQYYPYPPETVELDRSQEGWWKRNSLFMPKKAARIWLECTGVRCERLQDITEADAIAEGIGLIDSGLFNDIRFVDYLDPKSNWRQPITSFQSLWAKINGIDAWDLNPWVFVYSFKKLDQSPQSLTSPEKP